MQLKALVRQVVASETSYF